jgi:HSP20 family protein
MNEDMHMAIQRYQPWGLLQNELQQVFDKLLNPEAADQSNVVTAQWTPRVDIREEKDAFYIHADIPGVEPKDIDVHMEKGILTIKGERKAEHKEESAQFTRIERTHGQFYRRFALPDSADAEGITAKGEHGVLEIRIPKKPEASPRKITVG